jgi:hypothetical protein
MLKRRLHVLMVGSACSIGCGTPDLTDDVSLYVNQTNEVRGMLCACVLDLGNPDAECDDSLDQLTQVDAECLDATLDGHERDGQEYLDCANAALGDFVQCVAANVDCEPDTNDNCETLYTVASSRCTQLPTDVQAAFTACAG